MKWDNKNILLISPEPWDHIFVSKHHYALHLGRRGNRVYFLDPPGSAIGVRATGYPNVFCISYKGFPRGLRFYPSFLQKKIMRRYFEWLQTICSTKFDVVWSFDNSVFFDFSALPSAILKISHIVDFNQDFQTGKASSTADYCFCTSEVIRNRLIRFHIRVHKINHGYDASVEPAPLHQENNRGKIKVVYAGNLAIPYIDWELLSAVVDQNPEADFIFVGPGNDNSYTLKRTRSLVGRKNVSFVGRVQSAELASYYQAADILLVAYREKYQKDQVTNPHKIMEYLGSGKVIVATQTKEYEGFFPLIAMSEKNHEWLKMFETVSENLAFYNSDQLRSRRIDFARRNSYQEQIKVIERIISSENTKWA